MRLLAVLTTLAALVVALTSGRATPQAVAQDDPDCAENPLGPVPGYSIVTLADVTMTNTESDGRMVAGGNVTLTSSGVATKLAVDRTRVDLAAGGNIVINNSGINNGSVTYGGTISPAGFTVPNGTVTKATPPFDVPGLFSGLAIRSTAWSQLDPDGDVVLDQGILRLTGTNPVRSVFNLTAARLARAGQVYLRVPDGSTALINVTGASFKSNISAFWIWDSGTGQYIQPNQPTLPNAPTVEEIRRATLWNFVNATSVTLGPPDAGWQGTILAPLADVVGSYQHVYGSIVARSLSGNAEIGINPPDPCLPDPTPCPPVTPTPTPTSTPTATPTVAPTTTPTPQPTVTPTPSHPRRRRRRRRRPHPGRRRAYREPLPFVSPTPTPDTHGGGEPLDPDEDSGTIDVAGADAAVGICKKVMTPRGRAVETVTTRAGQTVRFRIRVTNLGTAPAHNVRVCDLLPNQLKLVRATVPIVYRNGRPCVSIPVFTGQREGYVTMRVARTARGTITNVAAVTSRDGGTRRNSARIRVLPAQTRGGGVTG